MLQIKQKNLIYKLIVLVSLLLATPILINAYILQQGENQINTTSAQVAPAETAIVLGARVYSNGNASPVLMDRLDTAIELYQAGKVKKLLLTGDHGQTNYDEVNNMRKYVLSKGVPDVDIFMDHAGFSTYESMYRARDVFAVKKAVVVTQQFHLPRALYIARAMGLEVSGIVADKRDYVGMDYLELREFLARNKAFLQLHILHSKPTYLGPVIPITGDGRLTQDQV